MSVLDDDSDAERYSAIDGHGVNVAISEHGARHRADGHVNPRLFVQKITGQMVVGAVE
ncbi:hypothetical protein ACIBG0_15470 [Nocardia sp. NPDC050630]|uniref:hypothetical protein n=1 Tax=Nocardia sp. NPDC050630 TaxID=3364321 RepID=UPI0037878385